MLTPAAPALTPWTPFYAMLGSAGATLMALMFVVITLISQVRRTGSPQQVQAFGTPTIVHFCGTILVASTMTAPWHDLTHTAMALSIYGGMGLVYTGIVTRRALHQVGYQPVLEDWVWHSVIPAAAYSTTLVAGIALPRGPDSALFCVAAATITLLFVGIHNSWDTLAYTAMQDAASPAPGTAAASAGGSGAGDAPRRDR